MLGSVNLILALLVIQFLLQTIFNEHSFRLLPQSPAHEQSMCGVWAFSRRGNGPPVVKVCGEPDKQEAIKIKHWKRT